MYRYKETKHDKKNDEVPNAYSNNKKTQLKILLEKIKNEENSQGKIKSRKIEKESKSGNVKEENYYKNNNTPNKVEKNPANMSSIKKELSTLQSTIDNLEKKLCIIFYILN